jgi:hypothetical protein
MVTISTVGGVSGLAVTFVVLLWSIDGIEARPPSLLLGRFGSVDTVEGPRSRRTPGFRVGAADRFSHGFGKRSAPETLDELFAPPEPTNDDFVMTDDVLVNSLTRNPALADAFVRRYVNINDDGFVSADELQPLTIE